MKIAITCHPTQGGSGVVATELATALSRRGNEVHLLASSQPFRLEPDSGVFFHKVNVPSYPLFQYPPYDLSLANKLSQIIKEYNVDIIHAHYAVPHAVTALMAKQIVQPHPVKVVTTLHGTDITLVGSHSDFFDLTRHAIKSSDAITAVSSWLSQQTTERFSLNVRPEVIPNFIDTSRFHPKGRVLFPKAGDELTLVHASNLRPVKRISHIIRIFERVQKEVQARLIILGDGPDKGMAVELAAELGLSDRIHFNGIQKGMAGLLRSAHLYLLLSDYESFGLSALEAMACGTPCAVSAAGGLPEVITHGESGLLCPVRDEPATTRLIVKLLQDPKRWAEMSRQAYQEAKEKFSVENIVPLYEALYARAKER